MHSVDLTPYQYGLQLPLTDVVTVGWLSAEHDFPSGNVEADVVHSIGELLWSNRVNKTRGFHLCELCKAQKAIEVSGARGSLSLGSAEIWLPSLDESTIFAAPDLLMHYVARHKYKPPAQFLEALAAARGHPNWNPGLECERRLERAFVR
jgi:hypothetical protein